MIFHSHRFRDILAYEANRSWYQDRIRDMTCSVLRNKVIGILGYGLIGREVARLCQAFGMKVHASLGRGGKSQTLSYRTQGTGDPEDSIPERWFQLSEFPKVASSFE